MFSCKVEKKIKSWPYFQGKDHVILLRNLRRAHVGILKGLQLWRETITEDHLSRKPDNILTAFSSCTCGLYYLTLLLPIAEITTTLLLVTLYPHQMKTTQQRLVNSHGRWRCMELGKDCWKAEKILMSSAGRRGCINKYCALHHGSNIPHVFHYVNRLYIIDCVILKPSLHTGIGVYLWYESPK